MAYTREQLADALRKADAAGNTADAQKLADAIRAMDAQSAPPQPSLGREIINAAEGSLGALLKGAGSMADMLTSPSVVGAAGSIAGPLVGKAAQAGSQFLRSRGVTGQSEKAGGSVFKAQREALPKATQFTMEMAGAGLAAPLPELKISGPASQLAKPAANALKSDTAAAAERQGVRLIPADAGGETVKRLTSAAKVSPFSAAPVVKAARASQQQLGEAASRVAANQGGLVTNETAGQAIKSAAERYTQKTSATASRLYDKAYEMAGTTKIVPHDTLVKIGEYITRLKNNPAAPEGAANELLKFEENISNGVNILGLRDARTMLSQGVYNGQLRSSVDQAMWKDILKNLSTDIENGLNAAGKTGAAKLFARADQFWKGRVEHIDEVLQPILGKGKSGEDIVKSVESMAAGQQGGNARLSRLLAQMTPEEAGSVRATIIDRMGKATPGQQTAAGDIFSPSTFLSNWNRMTPQAKASLFSDSGLRQDMNDLALLAEKMKSSQALSNFSNTGIAAYGNVGAMGALLVTHPVAALVAAGGQYLTGRLLASPRVAKLLVRAAKLPAGQQATVLKAGLTSVAARASPAISQDIQKILGLLNDNAGPLAAAGQSPENQQQNQAPLQPVGP